MKRALVLGAGLVSRPLVRYLLEQPDLHVRVATRTVSKAQRLIGDHPRGEAVQWVVEERNRLREMMEDSHIVISLLPYVYHVIVADLCIEYGIPLVTTSYVSKEMQERGSKAKEAGIILLNEIGLDPGIDHMSAMRTIDYIRNKGGRVVSFSSYCGALPSKEANTNPLGYKFSWSPRGVVLAARNSARFLKDGREVNIPSEALFDNCFKIDIEGVGEFEVYPNRDSIPYIERYRIPETKTMFRGTLRYPGWCELWKNFRKLGLLDDREVELKGMTYREFIASLVDGDKERAKESVCNYLDLDEDSEVIKKMEWLGFFKDDPVPLEKGAVLDVLTAKLLEKLQYEEGERDMVVLYDVVIGEYPDGSRERFISSLVDFGEPGGDSAVSRTVALPAAIAVKLILDGKIGLTGVHIPTHPEIYNPVLEKLGELGMKIEEKIEKI
jgi:saccharopine dehydrogenase (NADP+, L-glutamate forming)/spermidine synthase